MNSKNNAHVHVSDVKSLLFAISTMVKAGFKAITVANHGYMLKYEQMVEAGKKYGMKVYQGICIDTRNGVEMVAQTSNWELIGQLSKRRGKYILDVLEDLKVVFPDLNLDYKDILVAFNLGKFPNMITREHLISWLQQMGVDDAAVDVDASMRIIRYEKYKLDETLVARVDGPLYVVHNPRNSVEELVFLVKEYNLSGVITPDPNMMEVFRKELGGQLGCQVLYGSGETF